MPNNEQHEFRPAFGEAEYCCHEIKGSMCGQPRNAECHQHEHRWVGKGEYGNSSNGYMCADCGVDLDDLEEKGIVQGLIAEGYGEEHARLIVATDGVEAQEGERYRAIFWQDDAYRDPICRNCGEYKGKHSKGELFCPRDSLRSAATASPTQKLTCIYSTEPERIGKTFDETFGSPVQLEVSELGAYWQTWFEVVGEHATIDVVNATTKLVLAEREIYARDHPCFPAAEAPDLVVLADCIVSEIYGCHFPRPDAVRLVSDLLYANIKPSPAEAPLTAALAELREMFPEQQSCSVYAYTDDNGMRIWVAVDNTERGSGATLAEAMEAVRAAAKGKQD